ncbi:MAG: biotin carboxylase N-terminal domain-containing protein [Bacteroidota bacterium]
MSAKNLHKILIANRGEIALRIIRAVHALDKRAVVVHSEVDRDLPFVTEADEAYSLGSGGLSDTYLDQAKIIGIALEAKADAIHPGYGFLAENASFATACLHNGISFIGPSPDAIAMMGNKVSAREKAKEMGLPVLEAITGDLPELIAGKDTFHYPVLIKPSAGGGGKGMRIVHSAEAFEQQALEASREANSYFGSGEIYVEKYLAGPRHIEVQVIADHHGHACHLFERECSLQRRYQKIIEEAPSASITPELRERMTASALLLVNGMGYTNAGTVEFLVDADHSFYFLEMNTRIQVEHPVTEMVTGIDLVREQITIAEGHPLSFSQEELHFSGHAMEARIYAEDPQKDFMPSSGRIECFQYPSGGEPRIDSGFTGGNLVEPYYDPMIAKLIVHGTGREDARKRMIRSLKELHITGLTSNRDFLVALVRSASFAENRFHTRFLDLETISILAEQAQSRNEKSHELLLSAATLIALQSGPLEGDHQVSTWHFIGHWRILPEITLLEEDRTHRIRYELLKGRKRMKIRVENQDHDVCLEEKNGNDYRIRINHHVLHVWGATDRSEVHLDFDGHLYNFRRTDILDERYIGSGNRGRGALSNLIEAPLNGRIVQINSQAGDEVKAAEPLLVIESMKMENKICSPGRAVIKKIHVSVGDQVHTNQLLVTLDSYDTSANQ